MTAKQGFTINPTAVLQRGANGAILNFIPSSNLPIDLVSFNMTRRATEFGEDRTVTPPTDAILVQRTLAGYRTAFDELIRRYQRQAVAVSYRLLGNSHDALEITQNAFLKAFVILRS